MRTCVHARLRNVQHTRAPPRLFGSLVCCVGSLLCQNGRDGFAVCTRVCRRGVRDYLRARNKRGARSARTAVRRATAASDRSDTATGGGGWALSWGVCVSSVCCSLAVLPAVSVSVWTRFARLVSDSLAWPVCAFRVWLGTRLCTASNIRGTVWDYDIQSVTTVMGKARSLRENTICSCTNSHTQYF